ncbi:MAG: hypothetical protein ACKVHE_12155 [Planctomycetales bacterium]|jgi:hypothetical protein
MTEEYRTQSTERIKNEDWCAACKQPVEEWNVFFEDSIHSDSGYDKVRRCPQCNAKSFEDGSFNVGCLIFFIVLYGLPILCFGLLRHFNVDLNVDLDFGDDGTGFVFFVSDFLAACLVSYAVFWLWKRWLYRQRQADDQDPKPPNAGHVERPADSSPASSE